MAVRKQASKLAAHKLNNSTQNFPSKPVRSKIQKPNDTRRAKEEEDGMDVKGMFDMIMKKLGKLDIIISRMGAMEKDIKEVKSSVEFVLSEVQDLKEENKISKKTEEETKKRLEKLEQMKPVLNNASLTFRQGQCAIIL
ncbi:Hypothetical predicted protein [Paramuricea clavata]|uniref:Uncharacterized protein n=1 Tax=Paramuricea clavata TaxID=317549 RepID=A0A7D9JAI9_PARCT|nr:Hypothetical predicted protein [Paramuricea clavata]